MPPPVPPARRLGRAVVPVVAAALAGLLAACDASTPADGTVGAGPGATASRGAASPGPGTSGPVTAAADPAAVALAVDAVLTARDEALATGDAAAFAATVADPDTADGARQLAAFRSARALRATRVTHEVVPPVDDPSAVDVTVRYRIGGVDRADRRATVRYAVAGGRSGWRVVAQTATGADPAPPWLAMPDLEVRRGTRAVVAGTAGPDALQAAVATVDRTLPDLARHWTRTPRRTLVLLPDTTAEADALRGGAGPGVGTVAATTDGPTDERGLATGDRVVLDPEARRRLTPVGRDVVLTHELAHVAVRAGVAGTPPPWLSEGYADHVGYARAGLSQRLLAEPLVAAVRNGDAPTRLPSADALDPAVGDIEVGYLAAWQAAETVVALRGEGALRTLVRACAGREGAAAAERRCTAAMPSVLGLDRAGLTRAWRQRLADLAR